ncbi:MAG: ribonuclease HII, partial [Clostridiales bacterium]|nr:ribonuclease HII [Clostridiales bacterium]
MDWTYEQAGMRQGFHTVCGVDEAGRGPLAGPVYAAAVILPTGWIPEGLNDSKKLSEKKRARLFDEICAHALSYGIGTASEREIDDVNILNATFLAMRRAVELLDPAPDLALVDGNRLPELGMAGQAIVKGD